MCAREFAIGIHPQFYWEEQGQYIESCVGAMYTNGSINTDPYATDATDATTTTAANTTTGRSGTVTTQI
jgi:hypothetical protein